MAATARGRGATTRRTARPSRADASCADNRAAGQTRPCLSPRMPASWPQRLIPPEARLTGRPRWSGGRRVVAPCPTPPLAGRPFSQVVVQLLPLLRHRAARVGPEADERTPPPEARLTGRPRRSSGRRVVAPPPTAGSRRNSSFRTSSHSDFAVLDSERRAGPVVNHRDFSPAAERHRIVVGPAVVVVLELPQHLASDAKVKRAQESERPMALRWDALQVVLAARAHRPVVAREGGAAREERRRCRRRSACTRRRTPRPPARSHR